jgi:integrase
LTLFRLDDLRVELVSAHRRSFSSALPIGVAACEDSRRRRVGAERLTDQSVALIIKSRARAAHLPAELLPKLSGHSLRAGYATAAAAAEIEERKIANVTRHKNITVLRRYIRAATAFDDVGEVL